MEDVNLVLESLKFMALGMGIVFTFLTVMIFVLKIQAKLIANFFPEKQKEDVSPTWKPQAVNDEKDTIAAITAAIIHHNNNKG